jgi:hypothetical protein
MGRSQLERNAADHIPEDASAVGILPTSGAFDGLG